MCNFLPLAAADVAGGSIPLWLTGPFALLLLLIAVMPLSPARIKTLWEHYYSYAAIGLGLVVVGYYLLRVPAGGSVVGHTVQEYISFISLIGSLFVVAGGIHLKVKGEATPLGNVTFLAIGAVVANLIGTTGASMVLIRPFIRMNKIRISAYHVVFFIFLVSNCGGSLTPIGDPPLFLGYLRGVPFFWLIDRVILQWLATIGAILVAFYIFDRWAYARVPRKVQGKIEQGDTWRFEGGINVLLLLVIIGAVFLPDRFFLREIVMLAAAAVSYRFTPKTVHAENQFSFGPIKEVAFLFVGIFLTMMPALGYIDQHGDEFGVKKPFQYYVASGSLSSVLDNAPTYATFLRLAEATAQKRRPADFPANMSDEAAVVAVLRNDPADARLIMAVSLGAVFFGAMTYIGNGPNFMVKSIAESAGVKVPTFFGYIIKYSLPILLPILLLSGWLFL
ncbi:MAG: sodium:proton antiporter [Opitutae bacterium]|nr:sodium:proton antiporter [Opitutae bacterium]